MALFYCVGFPDLDRSWNYYGHVSNHPIFLNRSDAEEANEGKVTVVHEFYVRDALFKKTIDALVKQHELMLSRGSN